MSAKDVFIAIGTNEIILCFPLKNNIFNLKVYEHMIDSDEIYSVKKDDINYEPYNDFFRIFLKYLHQVV